MRPFQIITTFLLVACIATAAWFGSRLWQANRYRETLLAGVAPLPDLKRWPPSFQDHLQKLTDAIARSPEPLKPLGDLARLYFANGFNAQAKTALEVLRRQEPNQAPWAYFLGLILVQSDDPAGATAQFKNTVRLAPTYAPAWLQLANLHVAANRTAEAQAAFEKILTIDPAHAQALLSLAGIAHAQGRNDDALKFLADMVRLYPRSLEAHELLAEIHEKAGHSLLAATERQLARLSSATTPSRDPWLDELYLSSYDAFRLATLGSLLLQDARWKEALGYLTKASGLAPSDHSITTQLASAYVKNGEHKKAFAVLEQAIASSPKEPALYERFAALLVETGQAARAVEQLQHGISQAPASATLHSALGHALLKTEHLPDAVASFRESLRLDPTSTETCFALGYCLIQSGQREEARAVLESTVQMRPEYTDAWLLLGQLALDEGNLPLANDRAEKLLLLAPDDGAVQKFYPLAKLELGRKLITLGHIPEAEALFRAGLAVNPAHGPLHGGLGLIMGKEGKYDEARQEFQRYAELTPADPVAHLLLGRTLDLLQRSAEARASYRLGLEAARRAGNAAQTAQFEKLLSN